MRKRSAVLAMALLGGALLVASLAVASGGQKKLKADDLVGFQENPDISTDRKSTRLNSSHIQKSRMPSSA